jgi:segregation and condensation protein A
MYNKKMNSTGIDNKYNVKLEAFEGPLDLLLFLIKKEEVDIYNIPITSILDQYLEYIDLMKILDIEVASEFIVMASNLIYIKSKMLLPATDEDADEDEDPREDLVKQLLEYKKIKESAKYFRTLEEKQSEIYFRSVDTSLYAEKIEEFQHVSLFDLISAFSDILQTKDKEVPKEIANEQVSVEEKISEILDKIKLKQEISFKNLILSSKTRLEVIASFLAVLELMKTKQIFVVQSNKFGEILIKRRQD